MEPARQPGSRKDRARGLVQRLLDGPLWAFVANFVFSGSALLLTAVILRARPTDDTVIDLGPGVLGLAVLFLIPVISGIVLGYRKSRSDVVAGYAGLALVSVVSYTSWAITSGTDWSLLEVGSMVEVAFMALLPAILYVPAALIGARLTEL